ncbi:MAG: ABC transporter permease [Pseudomonadota bacterium]
MNVQDPKLAEHADALTTAAPSDDAGAGRGRQSWWRRATGFLRPELSPIGERRWANFKANKRGYYSLWVFGTIFLITLFAEFIANDRPLIVYYKGEVLAPVAVDYPEERFGGFLAYTDYRDPFIQEEISSNGWAIWPPISYSYRTVNREMPRPAPSPPSWTMDRQERCSRLPNGADDRNCTVWNWNWLGTDDQGRDVLARIIYGFRLSALFGLILTLFSSAIGIGVGAIQGYFGGRIDLYGQRFIEFWTSLPSLYILLIIVAILPPGFWVLLFVLLLFSWVSLVGLVRAEFLRVRNFDYIRAAKALGLPSWKIIMRHMLPNAMVATVTMMPFMLSSSITSLTALDFLGLGLPPGSPSLGELLQQGKANLHAWWLVATAFVTLAFMLSLLVFTGEAVRDALDPRKALK